MVYFPTLRAPRPPHCGRTPTRSGVPNTHKRFWHAGAPARTVARPGERLHSVHAAPLEACVRRCGGGFQGQAERTGGGALPVLPPVPENPLRIFAPASVPPPPRGGKDVRDDAGATPSVCDRKKERESQGERNREERVRKGEKGKGRERGRERLDLSLNELTESTFGDIFPRRAFVAQSSAPRLGSILKH